MNPASFDHRLLLFRMVVAADERYPGAVEPEAIDEAYRIARSASPAQGTLLAQRIQVLSRRGECGPEVFSDECARTITLLVSTASRKQGVLEILK